ncbi:ABC transporter substrate-binding protein [Sporosarcina psychrophila]|uniref:ABC transporter substrate-binding protein n=1 Tax=Sporosarcina psychrophila TaxID=1476 RepID=UPI00078C0027|nr:ABC transporter substrate-binding protein [Sporosarcina psychrophila]AMQ04615.1 ABC transporter substrate-binding protein [Sporosarcina psychrophila]
MKKNSLLIIIFSLLLMLAACSEGESSEKEKGNGNKGGEKSIIFATTSDVVGLSPILMNDSVSANATEHLYEQLFKLNGDTMEIEPLLAESYENPDELTWTIKLKKDISFHDGTPFNAEAVKYTFEKLRDPATAAPRASLMEPIDTITVIDEHTIEIKTLYPYGPFLATLSHTNAAIVSPTADQKQDLMREPVGTGPYKFVSWTPGDQVVMAANEDYWGGKPEMDKFTIKVVPEISTAISMLQAGEVQFIDNLPTEQIERLEGMGNINIEKKEGTTIYYLTFNHAKDRNKDPDFRKAVASAIDRDAFISKLNGLGVRSDSILGPKVFGYDESADKAGTPYDVEAAKALVEKNGYGKEPIKLLTANRSNFILMAEIVQAQLTEAGFKVQIESMEWATFLDTARAGEYDLTFLSWANVTADGSEMFYPNFHSDNVGSSNRSHYSNAEFDKLVDASRSTIDQDERKNYLEQANKLMLDEDVAVVMNHGFVTAALNKEYSGLQLDPNGKWYITDVTRK